MEISILGCGWLGQPLARHLAGQGYTIKGSTTTEEKLGALSAEGIEPYLIRLEPEIDCDGCESFWNSKILVLNIPPGRGNAEVIAHHTAQINSVIDKIESSSTEFVIFASSTSVYPREGGVMEESDAVKDLASRASGEALIKAEDMLRSNKKFDTTVLRFGGLYGGDRHPVKYLAGRKNLGKASAPVNLIHREDCIQIISDIIENDVRNEIFNAVADGHPPRKQYYTEIAKQRGLTPPEFADDPKKNYKVVSNRKLKKHLNYTFRHPNPLD